MSRTRLRRGGLVLASLAVHAVAMVGVCAVALRAPVAPLLVDLTQGGAAATEGRTDASAAMSTRPGPTGGGAPIRRAPAVSGEAVEVAPSARRPLRLTERAPDPSAPTVVTPPAPPSIARSVPVPEAPAPMTEHPAPSPQTAGNPARAPAESIGTALPSATGNPAGSSAPASGAGRAPGTTAEFEAAGAGNGISASGGARLVLALPGTGRGEVLAEYGPYLARFRRSVEDALVYPLAARRQGLAGRVELDVLLEPGGHITAVEIHTSSSHRVLDEAGIAAVRSLPPMPFPEDLPRRPLRIRLPLDFQLR